MIHTQEFVRSDWDAYLNGLSREAQDHPLRVRLEAPDLGDQLLADGLALVGISLEKKGSEQDAIEITAARADGTHLTHFVHAPERLYLARNDEDKAICLDIEDRSGGKTLVYIAEANQGGARK
jgi:hypothetical protein